MGLLPNIFSSSPAAAEDKRATEVRTGAVAPTRAERAQCWAARDTYFACLDAHGIVDALDDADGRKKAAAACRAESAGFEKDCAAQWVRDFFTSLSFLSFFLSQPPPCPGGLIDGGGRRRGLVGCLLGHGGLVSCISN
jgi:cytochrome c oxidase assembly factor 6